MSNETKHTPEPWEAQWNSEAWEIVAKGTKVADIYSSSQPDKDRDEPDARRIAACVNA